MYLTAWAVFAVLKLFPLDLWFLLHFILIWRIAWSRFDWHELHASKETMYHLCQNDSDHGDQMYEPIGWHSQNRSLMTSSQFFDSYQIHQIVYCTLPLLMSESNFLGHSLALLSWLLLYYTTRYYHIGQRQTYYCLSEGEDLAMSFSALLVSFLVAFIIVQWELSFGDSEHQLFDVFVRNCSLFCQLMLIILNSLIIFGCVGTPQRLSIVQYLASWSEYQMAK